MKTINIHQAKTQLSRLVEEAREGEPFIIAKAGKPVAKVTGVSDRGGRKPQRLGFLKGDIKVPDDFDRMGGRKLEQLFAGEE